MNDYSYQDIMRMQEEAKARVMEMRRRSRFLAEDFAGGEPNAEFGVRNAGLQYEPETQSIARDREAQPEERRARAIRMPVELPSPTERNEKPAEPRQAQPRALTGQKTAARGSVGLPAALRSVFGNLGEEESEKMFILALCLLLSQENGDEGLLLALMYLLT